MGELVNLRRVKKLREKAAGDAVAEANRRLHGRTKAERIADTLDQNRAARVLDQAKLDPKAISPSLSAKGQTEKPL